MDIRLFAAHEIPVLLEIEQSARQRYANIPGLEFVTSAPGIKPERFLDGETWVAELDGVIYGYALLQPMDGYLYIANIMVKDGASELGIGRSLMERAHERAQELGLSGTALATFKAPRFNGPWYRKLGYQTMQLSLIGPGLQAILDRHAGVLDMNQRETLWRQVTPVRRQALAQ
jgi:ribosomal protein S18 acetylase RimI-like enzyme